MDPRFPSSPKSQLPTAAVSAMDTLDAASVRAASGPAAQPGAVIGHYKLLELHRRGRLRRRVHGRAGRAGVAARRAQDHQAGDGHPAGDRALRGRATGAGADGPPEHRQGLRRRRHRDRPAVLRDGAGRRASRSPTYCDRAPAHDRRAARAVRRRSATPCSTRTRRGSSTATSSRATSWSRMHDGRAAREGHRLRHRQGDRAAAHRETLFTEHRPADRHAGVHEPGAGRGQRWTSTRAPTCTRSACCSTSC